MSSHLTWPPVLVQDGVGVWRFAEVEQDSTAEVRQGVAMLCELRPGHLPWALELGIPDPLGAHDSAVAADDIEAALTDLEPRARTTVTVVETPDGVRSLRLRIEVSE